MAGPTPTAPFNDPVFFSKQTAADEMDAMDDSALHGADWDDLASAQ